MSGNLRPGPYWPRSPAPFGWDPDRNAEGIDRIPSFRFRGTVKPSIRSPSPATSSNPHRESPTCSTLLTTALPPLVPFFWAPAVHRFESSVSAFVRWTSLGLRSGLPSIPWPLRRRRRRVLQNLLGSRPRVSARVLSPPFLPVLVPFPENFAFDNPTIPSSCFPVVAANLSLPCSEPTKRIMPTYSYAPPSKHIDAATVYSVCRCATLDEHLQACNILRPHVGPPSAVRKRLRVLTVCLT